LERVRKALMAESMEADCAQVERLAGADFARRLQRTGWGANFMSYDSMKWVCCQEKYILGELLVRTDWQVVGGTRVTPAALHTGGGDKSWSLTDCESFR